MLLLLADLAVAAELPGLTPLGGLDLATPDAALEPLAAVIGDAPFVGLGESKHCAGGYLEAKARVVRWLVETRGVRLVTLETPWVQAQPARRYVATGEGSPEAAMASIFGAFHDSSTAGMFAWLRAWNETHPDDPVQFTGFDVQDRPATLEAVLRDAEPPWRALAEATLRIRRSLDGARDGNGDYSTLRDEGMADTLMALRDALAPGARTVVLAHNAHLMRRGSETHFRDMGEHLAERLGDDYVAIGLVGSQVDSLCQGWTTHGGRLELEPMLAEALDAPAGLLDLSDARWREARVDVGGWSQILPGEQYDALLYLDRVRASDVGDPGLPWVDADGQGAWGGRVVVLYRTEPTDAERERLWSTYAAFLASLGYAPTSRVRRAGAHGSWQRFRAEGVAQPGELRVEWTRDDTWNVTLSLDPAWPTRLP